MLAAVGHPVRILEEEAAAAQGVLLQKEGMAVLRLLPEVVVEVAVTLTTLVVALALAQGEPEETDRAVLVAVLVLTELATLAAAAVLLARIPQVEQVDQEPTLMGRTA